MPTLQEFLTLLLQRGGLCNIKLVSQAFNLADHQARHFLNDTESRGHIVRRFYGRGITYQLTKKGATFIGFNNPYAVRNSKTDDEAARALSRFWLISQPLKAGQTIEINSEKVAKILGDFNINLPPNFQGKDDLILDNGSLQVMVYVPTNKPDIVIKRTLITYLMNDKNIKVGFYTAADFVETLRQIIKEYTDELPPLEVENIAGATVKGPTYEDKMKDAADNVARLLAEKKSREAGLIIEPIAAPAVAEAGEFSGAFLPVRAVIL